MTGHGGRGGIAGGAELAITNYYGEKCGTTFLDIYSVTDDVPVVHRRLRDQEAYDTWHLADLFKQVLRCREVRANPSFDGIVRKEKNLLLYLILACRPSLNTILELGSTLFELIDGLELVRAYAASHSLPVVDVRAKRFVGVELSQILRQASVELHPGYDIDLCEDVLSAERACDVLYDRSVSNYAFESADEFAEFVAGSQVGLLNTYFSLAESFVTSRLGKKVTYFSLAEVAERLPQPLFHLFGDRAPGPDSGSSLANGRPCVEGFFLYCAPDFVEAFLAMAHRDEETKGWFRAKGISPKPAQSLLRHD